MNRRDGESVASYHDAIYSSRTLDQEETVVSEPSESIGKLQVTVTVEFRDASGPSILDFHTKEFASRVGRHVKIAVAAEGDPVEPGTTALRRRKSGILREYVKGCGADREF